MKCIFIDYFMEGDFLSRNLLLFKTQPYINDRIFFTIVKSFIVQIGGRLDAAAGRTIRLMDIADRTKGSRNKHKIYIYSTRLSRRMVTMANCMTMT